jgi:hypothetical protein
MSNVRQMKLPALVTRPPTGKPSWPILLLAGVEKSGKSYSSAEASASPLVDRTLWVGIGEDAPDELGALPGARFEIVEHDGTYRGILAALTACAAQPADKAPNLLVLDSATRLWDLLCDELQVEANRRARVKAEKYGRKVSDEDATITMDQWNTAKQRWAHVMDVLRSHQGPVIVTARLEAVTVVKDGQPTTDRTWKVKAEKSLPFDVGAIVEMPARGETWLTGVRSLRFKPAQSGRTEYPDFTVEKLWTDLGLAEKDATSPRQHATNDPEDKPLQAADAARVELRKLCDERGWDAAAVAGEFVKLYEVEIKVASAKLLGEFLTLKRAEAAA